MTYMDNPNNFPGGHAGPNAQAAKPEPSKTPAQDYNDTIKAIFAAVGYTKEYALQWPKERASITFKRWFDEQLAEAASPPQAPAQRLTDERLRQMHHLEEFGLFCDFAEFEQIARAIEDAVRAQTKEQTK